MRFWTKALLEILLPTTILEILLIVLFYKFSNKIFAVSSVIVFLFMIFTIYFFRNPERTIPDIPNAIISPADGKIIEITKEKDPYLFEGKEVYRISIFLSVFNVHLNRIPTKGKIIYKNYNKGKFLAAFNEKASLDNEQAMLGIETNFGKILVKQIAGLIARRIIYKPEVNDKVSQGSIYGMIKFGSRTDILYDADVDLKIKVGDKVKGGESVIGVFK